MNAVRMLLPTLCLLCIGLAPGQTRTIEDWGRPQEASPPHGPLELSAGLFGGYCSFDGINDYVRVPHASCLDFGGKTSFTVELWFRKSANGEFDMVNKGESACGWRLYVGVMHSNPLDPWAPPVLAPSGVGVRACNRAYQVVQNTFPITNNTWCHLALTVDRLSGDATLSLHRADGSSRRWSTDWLLEESPDLNAPSCEAVVDEITAAGGTAIAVGANVADEAEVGAAVDRIAAELGAPTVLVNNAGIIRDNMLHKMSVDDWDAVLGVHLRGAFLMSRAVQPYMREADWGRIVNLSSTSALGNRGQANYSAAKAGIQGLTKTLAIELGRFNVTANAIAPGFIQTDMTAATAERIGLAFDDFVNMAAQQIPVGRVGQPEDIAHTVSFLASEGAGFVSGQVIYVAGGPKD